MDSEYEESETTSLVVLVSCCCCKMVIYLVAENKCITSQFCRSEPHGLPGLQSACRYAGLLL